MGINYLKKSIRCLERTYCLKTIYPIGGETLTRWNSLVGETFDIFSLIKQEDEKFSHQSDWTWHWQGPSDWMFNYWQWLMSHHRPNHPQLAAAAAAPSGRFHLRWNTSWLVGRHGRDIRINWKFYLNLDLYLNVFMEIWQRLSFCKWAYLRSPCRYPLSWTHVHWNTERPTHCCLPPQVISFQ